MTSSTVIAARELTMIYGTLKALDRVTLDIRSGECVALVGPNGAGKSTLIKISLGLISPNGGDIKILGASSQNAGFDNIKRQIGFLPEQVLFHSALTGRQTLHFYARLKGAEIRSTNDLLARVQLSDSADCPVSTYSKGMRQRLGLAQALIGDPKILLLDEPMSGLDPEARSNFFKILDEVKGRGAAIVLSSHILTELEARTDRVAILSRGLLKAMGSIEQLRADLDLHAHILIRANVRQMEFLSKYFADRYEPTCFSNGVAVLECGLDNKLALLKELMSQDLDFENLDIVEPSLEHVFAAHTAGGSLS